MASSSIYVTKPLTAELSEQLAAELTQQVALSIESSTVSKKCIFRVSATLRRHNDNVFDPNIVSIGPFHRGKDRLAPMEVIKLRYLGNCIGHPTPPPLILDKLVERVRRLKIEEYGRAFYAEPIHLNEYEFIKMMVIDGCFLIELFRKYARVVTVQQDDPIISSSWMLENMYHDLILLENQIPWLVLEHLVQELPKLPNLHHSLFTLVFKFFENKMLTTEPVAKFKQGTDHEFKHILDMLHSCLLSSSSDINLENARWHRLPPVTDLLQVGIKFKIGTPVDIFNIKFKNGELEIPPISIQSNSESLFRNLIAYEQYHDCEYKFTSYAVFMDYLINTTKDVDVLSDEGILQHASSTEDISVLFNRLYNDTLVYKFYYAGVSRDVHKYYKSKLPRWGTSLRREYCKNPWRISSVVAAILILVFTFTQTGFAILSFFLRK